MIEKEDAPRFGKVAILGVGLMGGSIGRALIVRGMAKEVCGLFRREATLDEAVAAGAVTHAFLEPEPVLEGADAVLFATGVGTIIEQLERFGGMVPDGAFVTDVGSTKGVIVGVMERVFAGRDVFPAGGHPLYGSHRKGPAAGASLDPAGKKAVVTPLREHPNAGDAEKMAGEFWRALGMEVETIDAGEHDRLLAWSSHLPHLAAMLLVKSLPGDAERFVSSGFLDTTRVAGSPAGVWRDIFLSNRKWLREAAERFEGAFAEMLALLEAGDDARLLEEISLIGDRRARLERENKD